MCYAYIYTSWAKREIVLAYVYAYVLRNTYNGDGWFRAKKKKSNFNEDKNQKRPEGLRTRYGFPSFDTAYTKRRI